MILAKISIRPDGSEIIDWQGDITKCCFVHEKKFIDAMNDKGVEVNKVKVFCKLNQKETQICYPDKCPLMEELHENN